MGIEQSVVEIFLFLLQSFIAISHWVVKRNYESFSYAKYLHPEGQRPKCGGLVGRGAAALRVCHGLHTEGRHLHV